MVLQYICLKAGQVSAAFRRFLGYKSSKITENGAGGKWDTPPEIWFGDKPESYLDLHLIPKNKDLWNLEHFDDFIDERKKLILNKFKHMIQQITE